MEFTAARLALRVFRSSHSGFGFLSSSSRVATNFSKDFSSSWEISKHSPALCEGNLCSRSGFCPRVPLLEKILVHIWWVDPVGYPPRLSPLRAAAPSSPAHSSSLQPQVNRYHNFKRYSIQRETSFFVQNQGKCSNKRVVEELFLAWWRSCT